MVYYRGKQYEMEKKAWGGDRKSKGHNDPLKDLPTAEKLAEQYHVAPKTIKRDAKIAKAIDKIGETSPIAKQKILSVKQRLIKRNLKSWGCNL